MKQARFALITVIVLSVVGGAMAFKVNRSLVIQIYTERYFGNCTEPTSTYATTNPLLGMPFTTTGSTIATPGTGCTTIRLYANQ